MLKKIVYLFISITSLTITAQEVGIRLGNFNDSNVAIDGIVNFDDHTRLHGDITFGSGIGANLLYDFKVDQIDIFQIPFQYYYGVGASSFLGDPFILGVNGEIGIEYLFKKTPITIGLDWRPQVNIITKTTLELDQFGFNIRYRLNEL